MGQERIMLRKASRLLGLRADRVLAAAQEISEEDPTVTIEMIGNGTYLPHALLERIRKHLGLLNEEEERELRDTGYMTVQETADFLGIHHAVVCDFLKVVCPNWRTSHPYIRSGKAWMSLLSTDTVQKVTRYRKLSEERQVLGNWRWQKRHRTNHVNVRDIDLNPDSDPTLKKAFEGSVSDLRYHFRSGTLQRISDSLQVYKDKQRIAQTILQNSDIIPLEEADIEMLSNIVESTALSRDLIIISLLPVLVDRVERRNIDDTKRNILIAQGYKYLHEEISNFTDYDILQENLERFLLLYMFDVTKNVFQKLNNL
ncbi:MAG TPA: hypothetical protein VLH19_02355 [Patescibacteria group bacterium]|nr:hypothetical protein [Patescibacteria group bacterium]